MAKKVQEFKGAKVQETTATATGGGEVLLLPIGHLVESGLNHRRQFADMAELAESIKVQGVLCPLLVRWKDAAGGAGRGIYEIVCGARRYRAAKLAGLEKLPVVVRQMSDGEARQAQIVENDQRQDPNPMEQAQGYQEMVESGLDVKAIAGAIGRCESYVAQRLVLMHLIGPFKELMLAGKLALGHGLLLARLTEKDQELCSTSHHFAFGKMDLDFAPPSVEDLRQHICRLALDLAQAPFDTGLELAGKPACTSCSKRTGFNRALFADIDAQNDLCMDGACHAAKVAELVAVQMDKLRAKGIIAAPAVKHFQYSRRAELAKAGVVELSTAELVSAKRAKSLPKEQVRACVVQEGKDAGKTVWALTPAAAKVRQKQQREVAKEPGAKEADRPAAEKLAENMAVVREIKQKMLKNFNKVPASDGAGRFLATAIWLMAGYDEKLALAEHYGWITAGGNHIEDEDQVLLKHLAEDGDGTLAWDVVGQLTVNSLPEPDKYYPEIAPLIYTAAGMLGVAEEKNRSQKSQTQKKTKGNASSGSQEFTPGVD